MDRDTRAAIERATQRARKLIEDDFSAQLEGTFDVLQNGTVTPKAGSHLSPRQVFQRDKIVAAIEHKRAAGMTAAEAVKDYLRDAAFTTLNRFVALKMLEARGLVQESITKGEQSAGYREFCGMAPGVGLLPDSAGYRLYMESLFEELSTEIKVLFARRDPASVLWPKRATFESLLAVLNTTDLSGVWGEDETIGWLYQYWNDPAERKNMRDEVAAPRNSRELAVRNQFFTPRYVVEFLTDNTLGRIWYEMTRGETKLKEQCRFIVRRPTEIFLQPDETAPEQPKQDNLAQEDLLKQPVYTPHRPIKDPRTILMLDPACGSMHFGLYAFDLFEVIYDEAWELEEKLGADALSRPPWMKALHDSYADKDPFLKDVPRLIIEHNLHGIDIDPRCAQIAGLSLWLRAQKAWQRLGLKPAERPVIKCTNIVCAEPMPGEKQLLRDFVEREFPAEERSVFLRLLEAIFDKMQLAGEAGSLLKIEEEIHSAVEEARAAWQKLQNRPAELFSAAELNAISKQPELDTTVALRLLTSDFFERVEERVYAALRDYAEQAENGGGLQRRLFAEDAARGFAFIDVCRKRYDVAVMNPPFGDTSDRVAEMLDDAVPIAKKNTYIASIVIGENRLASRGMLGAITDGSFIHQTRYEEFRDFLLDGRARKLSCMTANGWGVLDSYVETASFVLNSSPDAAALFTDLRECADARAERLLTAIEAVAIGSATSESVFLLTAAFRRIPKSVLTFWLPTPILEAYRLLPSLAPALVDARCGLSSSDNPRFYKLRWEVPPVEISRDKKWVFLSNGGSPAPLFRQQLYVVNYERDGAEIKTRVKELFGSETRTVINQQYYFRAGFTYGKRTESFTVQFLPGGHAFSNEGQAIFPTEPRRAWHVIAYLNTSLVAFLLNSVAGQHKESGYVGSLPSPPNGFLEAEWVEGFMRENYQVLARYAQGIPEAQSFSTVLIWWDLSRPATFKMAAKLVGEASAEFSIKFARVDELLETSLGFSRDASLPWDHRSWEVPTILYDVSVEELESVIAHDCIGYAIGIIFGRWDIRYATGEKAAPELPDPFSALPVCPPGQLQNARGLPARPEDVPAAYPVRIPWDGILVDDPNHPLDIELRVREVIEIISKDRAEAIEHEACEILGVKSLRDYFRKPAGFFADHLKRYSKSRRQAPIYWPLSTTSGSYTVWLYYHRFSLDTLYNVAAIAKEKLAHEERRLAELVREQGPNPTAAQRKEQAAQEAFATELRGLQEEIGEVARLWRPDLNDGVILNYGPLWRMIAHKAWQKKVKECWHALVKGDYDWAHLAMHLWPERVVPKCTTDRSLAIAHGLEDVFWVEDFNQRWRAIAGQNEERDHVARYWAASPLCKVIQMARKLWEQRYRDSGQRDDSWWQDVEAGVHDDHPLALLLWPDRVCVRAFDDPQIAAAHGLTVPKQTTGLDEDKDRVRCEWVQKMLARYSAVPESASFLSSAFSSLVDVGTWQAWWECFDRGEQDSCAVARYLRSAAVSEKCQNNVGLAIIHGVERFFFVDRGAGLSARLEPAEELSREVTKRTSPAVKSALSNLSNAPVIGAKSHDRNRRRARPAELRGSR